MMLHGCGDRVRRAAADGVLGRRGWRAGLAAVAVLAAVAAAGCSGSPSPTGGGTSGPSGSGGLVSPGGPGGVSGSGGLVSPGTGGGPVAGGGGGEPEGAGLRSGVTGGALFGGDLPLVPETGRLGRGLAIVRAYFRFGQQFPNAKAKAAMRSGSSVLASLDSAPRHGQGSYASIIAGRHDGDILRFMRQEQQAAVAYHLGAIYFSFEHEANTPPHQALGTPAQFIQAWDHVRRLAASAHLLWNQGGRLHFVLILTHLAYFPQGARPRWSARMGQASSFFPGKDEVDILAADGYNTGGCRHSSQRATMVAGSAPALTPAALFGPVVSFARSQGGLPVFIAEWASVAYSGSSKQASFIGQMRGFVTANREIAAAMYWNSRNPANPGCLMSLNNQPSGMSALAAMGHSPGLQGRVVSPGQS